MSKFVLYNLACAGAILHRQTGAPADADRAIQLLRAAVERGYTQRRLIDRDPDLDGLRERADYRALVGGISNDADGAIKS